MTQRPYLRFPGFLEKAVTLSYDDGTVFDIEMKKILDNYGLKCTFNLCSDWFLDEDTPNRRKMTKDEAKVLYSDKKHEIAVHGVSHRPLACITEEIGVADIINDRIALESVFERVIKGAAYANGSVDDVAVETMRKCGIEYARTICDTMNFDIPTDWLRLNPTVHHTNPELMNLTEHFLEPYPSHYYAWQKNPKLFYLWGHSYEFHDADNWDVLESFCKLVGKREDVWYATNGEVYAYVKAYDSLRFSADGRWVQNPSALDVFLSIRGKSILVGAGQTIRVNM